MNFSAEKRQGDDGEHEIQMKLFCSFKITKKIRSKISFLLLFTDLWLGFVTERLSFRDEPLRQCAAPFIQHN